MFPKGEKIKRAIKNIIMLANEASIKFDLNPLESDFLVRFFKEQGRE